MMTNEFRDLHKLTRKRTRDAAALAIQLLDDQDEVTALLMACGIDFIEGAVHSIREDDDSISKDEALGKVLAMLLMHFGADKVLTAFKSLKAMKESDR
jgi:hypothetical protein